VSTAFITGASRGIGAAIADCFRRAGCRVLAPSSQELDLSDPDSIQDFFSRFSEPVDILVNNAGINRLAGLDEVSDESLSATLQVNLQAPILLAKALSPGMVSRRSGRILNVSSIWSLVARPRRIPYTASKAALSGVTRALAVELAPHNVLVNAIAPGYVDTDLTRQNNSEQDLAAIRSAIPMHRLAEPDEIAQLALFLCSEKNTYLTGQTLVIDGGYTLV
jgi:NAD(P)-dependent dehydrogenase (short-subunit alcohol dehydrogenase family)